jgi:tripartite-type tricarboxylate transporter receptor subunit TctC
VTTELTRRSAIAGAVATLAAAPARANPDWPDRPITIMHGFPAGGPTDLLARIIADGLTRRLGQRVVVEGKPGASGTTAAALVARAAPDGYTLFAVPSGHTFAAATFKTLPYRTVEDFSMISMFSEYPYLMATYTDHSIRSVADLTRSRARAARRCFTALRATARVRTLPSSFSPRTRRSASSTCPIAAARRRRSISSPSASIS